MSSKYGDFVSITTVNWNLLRDGLKIAILSYSQLSKKIPSESTNEIIASEAFKKNSKILISD